MSGISTATFLEDRTRGPSIVSDQSRVIEVASLSQKLTPIVKEEGNVISTNYIYLGLAEFRNLFYSVDGEHFSINDAVCTDNSVSDELAVLFDKVRFNNKFIAGKDVQKLNLLEYIMECYENDLSLGRECWETCSVVNLTNSLGCIRSLCDMGKCQVDCALKYSEIQAILKQSRFSRCYNENEVGPDCAIREVLVITAHFKSSNPDVRDCIIKFRFAVDWCCDPCQNPWLTHFVNPRAAIGALFLSSQQTPSDTVSPNISCAPIMYKNLPQCLRSLLTSINNSYPPSDRLSDAKLLSHAGIGIGPTKTLDTRRFALGHRTLNPIGRLQYKRRVSMQSVNMTVSCVEPLYGRPASDPLKAKELEASGTYNFNTPELLPADGAPTQIGQVQPEYHDAMINSVDWTTNPCGGNPNAGSACGVAVNGVWPGSWPLSSGGYDTSSLYAGGDNVTNWFWHDWFNYQIDVKFNRNNLCFAYQPVISTDNGAFVGADTGASVPAAVSNVELDTEEKDQSSLLNNFVASDVLSKCQKANYFMIPLAFKWQPWMSDTCVPISLKYWCDYKELNGTEGPVDLFVQNGITANSWTRNDDDKIVLPIFNDASKHPRMELLVQAPNDSGKGETITRYTFNFCVEPVSMDQGLRTNFSASAVSTVQTNPDDIAIILSIEEAMEAGFQISTDDKTAPDLLKAFTLNRYDASGSVTGTLAGAATIDLGVDSVVTNIGLLKDGQLAVTFTGETSFKADTNGGLTDLSTITGHNGGKYEISYVAPSSDQLQVDDGTTEKVDIVSQTVRVAV